MSDPDGKHRLSRVCEELKKTGDLQEPGKTFLWIAGWDTMPRLFTAFCRALLQENAILQVDNEK